MKRKPHFRKSVKTLHLSLFQCMCMPSGHSFMRKGSLRRYITILYVTKTIKMFFLHLLSTIRISTFLNIPSKHNCKTSICCFEWLQFAYSISVCLRFYTMYHVDEMRVPWGQVVRNNKLRINYSPAVLALLYIDRRLVPSSPTQSY